MNNTCGIAYGPAIRDNCTLLKFNNYANAKFDGNTAMIEVSSVQADVLYCFVVTVRSNGSAIAIIEGTFLSTSTQGMFYYAAYYYYYYYYYYYH